jgi:hypothetical protein
MQIKETLDVSFPAAVESPPLEDVVVLADSAGVALGVPRTFSARVRSVRDDGSGLIASKCVKIPLVGSQGEVLGILCHTGPRSDTRGVVAPRGRETVTAIAYVAQFVVQDINNLFAVIGSGLRLLERQSDAAYRKAIVGKCTRRSREARCSAGSSSTLRDRAPSRSAGLSRLFLPRVRVGGVPSSLAGMEIAYTPSPTGSVFHVVNPATAAPTS